MKTKDIILAILITIIWGFNFSMIKLGLVAVDPFILAGLRFSLCALPAIFFIKRPNVPIKYLLSYGLLFGVGLWGIVNLGIQAGLSAGIASLVLQFSAFFTIILGTIIFQESINRYQILGILIAFLGLISIIRLTDGSATITGIFLVIVGVISWSIANIIIKKSGTKEIFSFLVWSCLFSPIPLFLLAYCQHGGEAYRSTFSNLDLKAVGSILFQVYPATLFGYWIWNSLLNRYPVSKVAPLSLLVPVFAMLSSILIFKEHVGTSKLLSILLIMLGLVVGLFGRKISAYVSSIFKLSVSKNNES